jgi:hypothetical protein
MYPWLFAAELLQLLSFHSSGWLPTVAALVRAIDQIMWNLWWTKRLWDRFSSITAVSPANHSTDCSTLIIIIHHPRLVQ